MTRPTLRVFALEEDVCRLFRADATRLAWLDGFRAIAILWVTAYHTFVFVGGSFRHGEHEERMLAFVNSQLDMSLARHFQP